MNKQYKPVFEVSEIGFFPSEDVVEFIFNNLLDMAGTKDDWFTDINFNVNVWTIQQQTFFAVYPIENGVLNIYNCIAKGSIENKSRG